MTGPDDALLRVYFDPKDVGLDGYPYVWHGSRLDDAYPPGHPMRGLAVKDLIRQRAGHRCERCGHPYEKGDGEWSRCDEFCTHGGPIRAREAWREEEWRYYESTQGWPVGETLNDGGPGGVELLRWEVEARWRILTVHHLNGVKHDLRWWNLAALCQRCHLTIQAKVYLDRPWNRPHSEWFRPHAAGYYASDWEPEPTREEVLAQIDTILDLHATQGVLL